MKMSQEPFQVGSAAAGDSQPPAISAARPLSIGPDNGPKVPLLSLVTVRVGAPLPRLQLAFSGTLLLRNKSGTTPQNPFFSRRQLRQLDYKRRATFLAGSRRLAPRLSLVRASPMDGGHVLLT